MREMKDSGVKWIGEIPVTWNVYRNKNAFVCSKDLVGGKSSETQLLSLTTKGIKLKDINNAEGKLPESFDTYQYVKKDEMVMCLFDLDCSAVFSGLSPYDGMISPAYKVLTCTDRMEPKYADYWFQYISHGRKFNHYAKNIRYTLSYEEFSALPMLFPDREEQIRISNYLDAKCSKIDEIIEKQLSIIEKLKEYKLSIITEAVTSGINPDVEMKDSGSVWFGNIPINWEMKRLKYVFHIQKDIAGEEGHTVLSITQRGIIPKDFSNNEGQFANSYANYQLVHKGDFAMNHMDLLTGWVDISKYEGVTSPDYRVFVLNDKNGMCPKYYLYMMQMCYSARIFYGLGQGVSGMGRWRLQADKFLNFYIPIPPYDEQKKIADYITDKVNHIEVEIDKRNKLIKKYQEYKKSLIYEVVTGKKEV